MPGLCSIIYKLESQPQKPHCCFKTIMFYREEQPIGLEQGQQQIEDLCDFFAELSISGPCRIVGVTLVNKKTIQQLNFTEAQEACRLMGLTLASKDQVEAARRSGFETCR